MAKCLRIAPPIAAVLLVLTLTLGVPATAYADESAPPPEETAPQPAEETAPPAEGGGESLASTLPEGTELVVLDESGQSVPLATEEAADVLISGDPIWCPLGVAPIAFTGGCSNSYPSMAVLLSNIVTDLGGFEPAANGVIWIAGFGVAGADPTVAGISGGTFGTWKNFALTLKGGWDGTPGSTVTDSLDPSRFTSPLSVTGWNADVTLSDIEISSAAGIGLQITTTKNITLTRVNSHANSAAGADLNNSSAGNPLWTGKITITSSQFNGNFGAYGLQAISNNLITLNGVTASDNAGLGAFGAYLQNDSSPIAVKPGVSVIGLSTFNDNNGTGLTIYTKGPVTVADVTALRNGQTGSGGGGATVFNSYTGFTAPVTFTGTNVLSGNRNNGLIIQTNGVVKLSNIIANANSPAGNGLYIDACQNSGGLCTAFGSVTLTGSSQFKSNSDYGLWLEAAGAISLNSVNASGNGLEGAYLNNCHQDTSSPYPCTAPVTNVTLTGASFFNDNLNNGLKIFSRGAITLNSLTAIGNGSTGVTIDNCAVDSVPTPDVCTTAAQPVTITGTNVLSSNGDSGLWLISNGNIKVNNLTASRSTTFYGAVLQNGYGGSIGTVTLTGFNSFYDNYYTGLIVGSNGLISASNLTAIRNGLIGGGSGASLANDTSVAATPPGVVVSGVNNLSGNDSTNLAIYSHGPVTVSNLTASDSLNDVGAYISNPYSLLSKVTFTGASLFEDNHSTGLYIESRGAVTLASISANGNGTGGSGDGLRVINSYGGASLTPGGITLTGNNTFNANKDYGVYLLSYGAIAVSNLTADYNHGPYAAFVYNSLTSALVIKNITLSGVNSVSNNDQDGLHVSSFGLLSLSSLTAVDNGWVSGGGVGAELHNHNPGGAPAFLTPTAGVTLSGTNTFEHNYSSGLEVLTLGAITANNLRALRNGTSTGHDGAYLNNSGSAALTPPGVTLTGTNLFNDNAGRGLLIYSRGTINASSVSANQNGQVGAQISNALGSAPVLPVVARTVTLTGISSFNENYLSGLQLSSYGTISLNTTSLTANDNGLTGSLSGDGVAIGNAGADPGAPKNVILAGKSTLNGNYGGGLAITSRGAITAANLTASYNQHTYGALLNNTLCASLVACGGVTLTGVNTFNGNAMATGLYISSKGAVTLNSVTASYNSLTAGLDSGAEINNVGGPGSPFVKLLGTNTFDGNKGWGLRLLSYGAITVNNLSASRNVINDGAFLNNTGSSLPVAPGVTISGFGYFNANGARGLDISSYGVVSLTRIIADGNLGSDGLRVINANSILITCGSFNGNAGSGAVLDTSFGGATLIGVFAAGNSGVGINASGVVGYPLSVITVRNCPLPW